MTVADLHEAERLSSAAFYEVDRRTFPRSWPDPEPRTPERAERWRRRAEHLLHTDPGGCWVAEQDGELVGFATSLTRELIVATPVLEHVRVTRTTTTAEAAARPVFASFDHPRVRELDLG